MFTKIKYVMLAALAFMCIAASSASAAWTHLGGDPLFPGGIQGSGQTARNDFVKKSRTSKFSTAMKYAGLNQSERTAVKAAIVHGQFSQCTLQYGDHFVQESFGTNGTSVDRNVTFLDPRYKAHGAPAFCLTVKVSNGKDGYTLLKLKIPFACVNFGVMSRKHVKHHSSTTCGCKPTKTPPAKPSCSNGQVLTDNSGAACQSGVATSTTKQDATSKTTCGDYAVNSCNSTVTNTSTTNTYVINANCSKVVVTSGNGASTTTWKDSQGGDITEQQCSTYTKQEQCVNGGGNWNSTQNACTTTPPPPPPVQHRVNAACRGFEEVTGGASFLVVCDVTTDDQSAAISLTANANNANSRVSGVNCYSQGGKPTCTGNGTYQFRVTGVNSGSTVLSSSISVLASANDVQYAYSSDPFPVDPSAGGF